MNRLREGVLTVCERGSARFTRSHARVPIHMLAIQAEALNAFSFTDFDALSSDLSVVLGAVRCADRAFTRHHGCGWARNLILHIPVYEVERWKSPAVVSELQNTLNYLTGDCWNFHFVRRRTAMDRPPQAPLPVRVSTRRVFVPYSHGLDSYAQTELARAGSEEIEVVPVHLNPRLASSSLKPAHTRFEGKMRTVSAAGSFIEPRHSEPTYRTRAFIFNSLAAWASVLSRGNRVLVPENGQGTWGPSLVPLGAEAPHRSCHPGFTGRLQSFVSALSGQSVQFVHPAMFKTKGQVLAKLAQHKGNGAEWLPALRSCSRDARTTSRKGRQLHCGVCGNCLLRRVAVHAAELHDSTPYLVSNVHARDFKQAFIGASPPRALAALADTAHNSVRGMQRLADILRERPLRVEAEIAAVLPLINDARDTVRDGLYRLLERHHKEWLSFLQFAGEASWLTACARG